MHELTNYLMEKYGKSIKEISKTEFENILINGNCKMISLDDVATHFNKINDDFREEFSTADGLLILEKENKTQLLFFEFKNIDYSNKSDRQMSVFYLKKFLAKMEDCEHNCEIYEDLKKNSEYLVDKSNCSMRSKPSDSLSLVYHIMKNYYELKKDEARDNLFKTEKIFFLVSNTQSQYIPFKNKSNRQQPILKQLEFIKRFAPYHYNMVLVVNENGFYRYFYNRNKSHLNC